MHYSEPNIATINLQTWSNGILNYDNILCTAAFSWPGTYLTDLLHPHSPPFPFVLFRYQTMMMKMQLFILLGIVLIGTMVEVGKGAPGEQPEDPNHQTQPGTLKTLYKWLYKSIETHNAYNSVNKGAIQL